MVIPATSEKLTSHGASASSLAIKAEVLRRFGSPINFVSSSSSQEFVLVLSVGRCKFHLSPQSVGALLQSVRGGHSQAFRVVQLADRVFRFSVSSKSVGFHIFKLPSFECSDLKIFFHLWHGGGPNYEAELRNWEAVQAAEWSDVVKRGRPPQRQPTHLTGANAIPVHGHHRLPLASSSMEFSNFKFHNNPGRRLVFTRINFGI